MLLRHYYPPQPKMAFIHPATDRGACLASFCRPASRGARCYRTRRPLLLLVPHLLRSLSCALSRSLNGNELHYVSWRWDRLALLGIRSTILCIWLMDYDLQNLELNKIRPGPYSLPNTNTCTEYICAGTCGSEWSKTVGLASTLSCYCQPWWAF
ncbi:uncharacterized protein ASPGLDRAFT_1283097 [Aspergillus glaucus CBS 516.65]|uniref:Uncharacterized protein n=1 Tax=Aspergillus glaucus CBS 516.65 TaxID=1160497 RepID=A0A1L9V3C1_ASPGL|nr:hypothetical protein ASPGLDRAFT_1283097 [Aspergillus glaucus CBS 516.65]OJJ78445.1 hypothetical protein ASPGLDRAFT_1283097 [Aspergillus glaucus CBS 516.65]